MKSKHLGVLSSELFYHLKLFQWTFNSRLSILNMARSGCQVVSQLKLRSFFSDAKVTSAEYAWCSSREVLCCSFHVILMFLNSWILDPLKLYNSLHEEDSANMRQLYILRESQTREQTRKGILFLWKSCCNSGVGSQISGEQYFRQIFQHNLKVVVEIGQWLKDWRARQVRGIRRVANWFQRSGTQVLNGPT